MLSKSKAKPGTAAALKEGDLIVIKGRQGRVQKWDEEMFEDGYGAVLWYPLTDPHTLWRHRCKPDQEIDMVPTEVEEQPSFASMQDVIVALVENIQTLQLEGQDKANALARQFELTSEQEMTLRQILAVPVE